MSLLIPTIRDYNKEALSDVTYPFSAFQPPKKVTVSQGASENLIIKQNGGYSGPWSSDETPYMVKPMNTLSSREYEAVCFVGPARSGKTISLVDAFIAYAIACDPGDTLVVQMNQEKAREFSKVRIDRMLRYSQNLNRRVSKNSHADNTHDKSFDNGMWLRIAWPTVSNLSGSDYRYVLFTDYDRMKDDIDGEGNAFSLGLKRTTTFMSRGMCVVESSPGRDIEDPHWHKVGEHEAPPVGGILGIYNNSDRQMLYWPCPHCGEFFRVEPSLSFFNLPSEQNLIEIVRNTDLGNFAADHSTGYCPHCGALIDYSHRHTMNLGSEWLAEGLKIDSQRNITGKAGKSSVAGFWLGGIAAAYQPWNSLVLRYLQGLRDYVMTGSDQRLKVTVNTDQGAPYLSRVLAHSANNSKGPESRKESEMQRFVVPLDARFLIASVDIQGGNNARFVVQVHAVGRDMEQWLVDRFEIRESNRQGVDSGKAPLDPASYLEDWNLLTSLLSSTYRTDDPNLELKIRLLVVDSGGEDGVTANAYNWYRLVRKQGYEGNVMLIKGATAITAPSIRESWVGQRRQGEKGDIPLYLLNMNFLKDTVTSNYNRMKAGPGYIHIPGWLPKAWFDELSAEVRMPDGKWSQVKARNEALDLSCYTHAGMMRLGTDRLNWDNPPEWARFVTEGNPYAVTPEERREIQKTVSPIQRRTNRSRYV